MAELVSVNILHFRTKQFVAPCIEALLQQTYPRIEILFIDNGSRDGSVELVRARFPSVRVIENTANLYFCKAHNVGIQQCRGDYIIPLNAEIIVTPDFVEQMVHARKMRADVGSVTGRLLRLGGDMKPLSPPVIDSTGMWFNPQLRHFDRGAEQVDTGQYNRFEFVFGASGACPLYDRKMLEDVAVMGQVFDEDFVIYREDADLAWRAQILGWRCLYTPRAVAYHLRGVRPSHGRAQIDSLFNMHSVKNRFLMRIKNITPGVLRRVGLSMLWRDLMVLGFLLLSEHTSLPALLHLIRLWPNMRRKRSLIMAKRRTDDRYLAHWFRSNPVVEPFSHASP